MPLRTELARLRATVDSSPLGELIKLGSALLVHTRRLDALLNAPPLPAGEEFDLEYVGVMAEFCQSQHAFEERFKHADPELREQFSAWDTSTDTDHMLDNIDERLMRRWAQCPVLIAKWNEPDPEVVKLAERIGEMTPEQAADIDAKIAREHPELHAKIAGLFDQVPVVQTPVPAPEPIPVPVLEPAPVPTAEPPAVPPKPEAVRLTLLQRMMRDDKPRRHSSRSRRWE
jgi:hypothetical protein